MSFIFTTQLLVTHVKNLDEVLLNFHEEIIKSPKLSVACKEFEVHDFNFLSFKLHYVFLAALILLDFVCLLK